MYFFKFPYRHLWRWILILVLYAVLLIYNIQAVHCRPSGLLKYIQGFLSGANVLPDPIMS